MFLSHLKSHRGDLVSIFHHKFKEKLKELLTKWTYVLFPRLIQAEILIIFSDF